MDVVERVSKVLADLVPKLNKAMRWPEYNSAHEGFAVLLEEVDELLEEVSALKGHVWMNQKRRDLPAMRGEALDVAVAAIRIVMMLDARKEPEPSAEPPLSPGDVAHLVRQFTRGAPVTLAGPAVSDQITTVGIAEAVHAAGLRSPNPPFVSTGPSPAEQFITQFRGRLYPGKSWPIDYPSAEIASATKLLAGNGAKRLEAVINFVASNTYWRSRAGTVTALVRHLPDLEAEAFRVPHEELTPDAAIVHRELDRRLRARDPGLALEAPKPGERYELNALVDRHGRDRIRFLIKAALDHEYFSKRVRDVGTLVQHSLAMIAESAETWASLKDDAAAILGPVEEASPK